MATPFLLEIITPERSFFCGEVRSIQLSVSDGLLGIQAMHEPTVVAIVPGIIRFMTDTEWLECSCSSGFAEIRPDETIIFVTTAEWPEEIDVVRAQRAKQIAEDKLKAERGAKEYQENQIALARAMARLKVGRRPVNL